MTATEFITLVGATGIFSVGLNLFVSYLMARSQRTRKGKYAAIRLALILEKFALDCTEIMSDIDNAYSTNEYAGSKLHRSLPKLQEYPLDIDWEALKVNLSSKVLAFPNEVAISNREISNYMEYMGLVDGGDGPIACGKYCALKGAQAFAISCELRKAYNLGIPEYMTTTWDCPEYLKSGGQRYEEQLKTAEEASQKASLDI